MLITAAWTNVKHVHTEVVNTHDVITSKTAMLSNVVILNIAYVVRVASSIYLYLFLVLLIFIVYLFIIVLVTVLLSLFFFITFKFILFVLFFISFSIREF